MQVSGGTGRFLGNGSGSVVVSGSEFPIEGGGGGVDGLFAELGIDIEGG